ncbi:MAG: FAD-dependent oxidoreductase [Nitrospinae bacterium]|nr:FAD-dependent oxidoreductase [Nitrospinota bacterium]
MILGLDFLKDQNHSYKKEIGDKVAIIGGGNTAIDTARTLLRQGARPLIIYRRSREEMPAFEEEILQAEEEGIIFHYLTSPTDIIMDEEGKKINLGCVKMKLGEIDETGRRRPLSIKDSNFIIEVDSVISAIGEDPDLSFLPADIKTNKMGIVIDTNNATTCKGIFAGGDAAGRPRTVVSAIGSGKEGAYSIDRYLRGVKGEGEFNLSIVRYEDLNLDHFEKGNWVDPIKVAVEERINNLKEVYKGFSPEMGIIEASRCFSCGVCNMCDNCLIFCPDIAVLKKKKGYEINYDYCKGCLICVEECPRSAMTSIEEIK